jgi:hypothetical protein
MAISFPINLPTGAAGIERVRFTPMNAVAVLRSPFTYASQVQEHQGQMWLAEVQVAPCKRAAAEPWAAFLTALKGPYGTFYLGNPNAATPQGVATGTPLIKGAGQSGETILTDGWTTSTTNILKAGDYIQIGSRLHKVKQNANSNGSGEATLEIWPRLRETPADNAAITLNGAKGLFRLESSSEFPDSDIDKERLYTIAFTAVEAI